MKQYKIKVELIGLDEPCYRVIVVDGNLTMNDLHTVIQTAMGWNNSHLYEFITPEGIRIVGYMDEDLSNEVDATKLLINDVYINTKKLTYIYDFGDYWEHSIEIQETKKHYDDPAIAIEAVGVCPPDDVGGIPGYQDFIEKLKNGTEEEKLELINWLGYMEYVPLDTKSLMKINTKLRELVSYEESDDVLRS